MARRERRGDRAPNAATHDVRTLDTEMVEETEALRGVVVPGQPLETSAGLAGLALVEDDARERAGQVGEKAKAFVDAERAPVLDRRVEPSRREHEQRRPFADHLVARANPTHVGERHQSPLTGRPARTSSTYSASGASSSRWTARIRPSSHGPPPSPPSTGIDTASTTFAPASGPE